MPSSLKWYANDAKRAMQAQIDKLLDDKAHQVLGHAQDNIREHDQIDTGFMHDSGYVESGLTNDFDAVPERMNLYGKKSGGYVDRSRAPAPPSRGHNEANVGFSADYTIDQELRNSFLWRGVEQTAAEGD